MRIFASKDKEKVRLWAKRNNRLVLWNDKKNIWHAATNSRHVPIYAVSVEIVHQ